MTIFSVNESLERDLLSDRGFVCSHLTPFLSLLDSNQVSGQTLEPYLVGRLLGTYESIGQGRPLHLAAEVVKSLDLFASNPALLKERECLQLVLSTDIVVRPIVGFAAIITLDKVAQFDAISSLKGNIFELCDDNTDSDFIFEIPSHISYLPYEFCADMDDVDTVQHANANTDGIALYVPYQAALSASVDKSFCVDVMGQDWVYRLINHYTQGHYKLRLACSAATRRPYAFALIVASMLGVSFDKLKEYGSEDYINLTAAQKYELVVVMKPLIEQIAYEFMSGKLISL